MNKYIGNDDDCENAFLRLDQLIEAESEDERAYLEILNVLYKDKNLSTLQAVSNSLVYIFGTSIRER